MKTLNLETVTRVEIKKDIAEAVLAGDIVGAKIRLSVLDDMISQDGFDTVEEITEYYNVKHFINNL